LAETVCRECGADIPYDWAPCPQCGWKAPDAWDTEGEEEAQDSHSRGVMAKPKRWIRWVAFFILGILALWFLLGILR
jgi:uncharacterized membrane protein YvbJ